MYKVYLLYDICLDFLIIINIVRHFPQRTADETTLNPELLMNQFPEFGETTKRSEGRREGKTL